LHEADHLAIAQAPEHRPGIDPSWNVLGQSIYPFSYAKQGSSGQGK
jgi:hypothetical protein